MSGWVTIEDAASVWLIEVSKRSFQQPLNSVKYQSRKFKHQESIQAGLRQQQRVELCSEVTLLANQISTALSQVQRLEQLEELVEARTAELKEVNRNLQQKVDLRMQSERMKDEFISVISHELRTPLTSLHSALKILATGRLGTLSQEGQQMLAIADQSVERLVRLINNVLDLQRIESGHIVMEQQSCNAASLITQAAEVMQAMAQQHGVTLVTQPEDVFIWADADYILQTLTNLLSNAIKFSSPGTTVWLTVAQDEQAKPHSRHIATQKQATSATHYPTPQSGGKHPSEAVFRVRDEGQGIPADQLERIFERFQQVDSSSRQKGGTGLGLAICRRIVEQHNGKIWAESILGFGSTFVFTMPALGRVIN